MGEFLGFRELRPGETLFGGKGSLIPIRLGKKKLNEKLSLSDPSNPVHTAIEGVVEGLSLKEKVAQIHELFPPKLKDFPCQTQCDNLK